MTPEQERLYLAASAKAKIVAAASLLRDAESDLRIVCPNAGCHMLTRAALAATLKTIDGIFAFLGKSW